MVGHGLFFLHQIFVLSTCVAIVETRYNVNEYLSRGLDIPPPFVRFYCNGECTSAYLSSAVYGIGPLLDAPQPDFAMPFNVLTLTCTLIAFSVTSIISILVRRSGSKSEGNKKLNALLAMCRKLSSVLPVEQQEDKEKVE